METVKNMIDTVVRSIVDDLDSVRIVDSKDESGGVLFDIQVGKNDTGKLIGKGGRNANSLRTLARAAGAKAGMRVQINVHKDPLE